LGTVAGASVMTNRPTSTPPIWMSRKHRIRAGGRAEVSRHSHSPTNDKRSELRAERRAKRR
jgi:hypothetical protein